MPADWRLLAAAGLALTLAACQEEAALPDKPRPVRTVEVAPTDLSEVITQTGTIAARVETDLGFRIDGRLATRAVDVGARVAAGDLLATLDAGDVANEVSAAEADLASATAGEVVARNAADRQRKLFEKQIVARAAVESADAEWKAAIARRDVAAASLANARNKLGYTQLISTKAGVVTAVGANAGQVVGAGQMVVRVAGDDQKEAVFDVTEQLIAGASPEIPVRVALTSDPAVAVSGTVREVSPTADPVTRTYKVRVALPDAPHRMTLGATVSGTVEIPGGALITVPASAISSADGKPAVYVVDPASARLSLKPVTVARYTATSAVIADGLEKGDLVVTAGVSKLRPDQIVALGPETAR